MTPPMTPPPGDKSGAEPHSQPTESRTALRRASQWVVRPVGAAFGVFGDDRPLRTPAGLEVVVASRPLAEAIAAELRAQAAARGLDIAGLPNLRLAATAIDRVRPARDAHIAAVAAYGETELLCYRAEHPADLVERQHAAWQPLLDWAAERFNARLGNTAGVMPQRQPAASLASLRDAIAGYDDLLLAALAFAVQTSGSLVVGLAMVEGRLDADQAFAVAELDESYQIEQWGEDAEAAQRRATRRADLAQVARFIALVRGR
jgi:chaperone required for assembly of F1-ATPase